MTDWFTVKIKYLKQLENGSITSKTEEFMLNALSFTEQRRGSQGYWKNTFRNLIY